mgnify:CR=1 FL=1
MQLNGGTNFVLIEEPTALPASPQIGFHVTLQQAPSGGGLPPGWQPSEISYRIQGQAD